MGYRHHVLETLREKICFEIIRPSWNVGVVVFEIGIIGHSLELRSPPVMFGQHPSQCSLATSYISSDTDMHNVCDFGVTKIRLFWQ